MVAWSFLRLSAAAVYYCGEGVGSHVVVDGGFILECSQLSISFRADAFAYRWLMLNETLSRRVDIWTLALQQRDTSHLILLRLLGGHC